MLLSTGNDPLEFDGSLFAVLDRYKAERLAEADDLRRCVAFTRALGDVLTGAILAEGRAILESIDIGNRESCVCAVYPFMAAGRGVR